MAAMSRTLSFEKYQGIGNDFLVIDAADDGVVSPELAAKLCDRRFGVGGDGVILVLPGGPGALARMRVINADGSIPEMCGNGIRCMALHVARHHARGEPVLDATFETDAGPRRCHVELQSADNRTADVTVDMGIARVLGPRRLSVPGETSEWRDIDLVEVNVGNPHAVSLRRPSPEEIDRIGPRLATHEAFPEGANIGFARVQDRAFLDLVVWERGVGLTLACGTGACAAVAAACSRDLAPWGSPVTVRLPGGPLTIWVEGDGGRARMRGGAQHVYSGRVDVAG